MTKTSRIFILFMICICLNANAYTNKKVILLAERQSQSDSTGYNFVNDLAISAYKWIRNGEVVLWDSPEKKINLTILDLKGIEKNSNTDFTKLSNLFIYENWSSTATKFSFTVKGFSFAGTNSKGEDVLFGFIEFNSGTKELFKNTPLHLNANGNYGSTLYSALMNMGYGFSLIYFDNGPLRDYKNSASMVKKSIGKHKKMSNAVRLPQSKLIVYGWDSSNLDQSKISDQLTIILSDFFNKNKQEFYNYGGDKYYSFLKNTPILISGFQVVQQWTKDRNGKISYSLISIIPNTVGIPLQPIPAQKLNDWKIYYHGDPLTEYLTNKDFPYSIKKINETIIQPQIAESFKNALFAGNWNTILSTYFKGQ